MAQPPAMATSSSPAKFSVTPRSSNPTVPQSAGRQKAGDVLQKASEGSSRYFPEKLQQLQSKLLANSAEIAEHREEVEAALSRLAKEVQAELSSGDWETLRGTSRRLEELEGKVTRASELSCDVYDQQVEYQTQCDNKFSAMRQALGEQRTLAEATRVELIGTQGAACARTSADLCRALTALRPELPQLCRGFAPEEASSDSGRLGSGEWLETVVNHADLVAFTYGLLRRLRELLESIRAEGESVPELSPCSHSRSPSDTVASAGTSAALREVLQAQRQACEEIETATKAATKQACEEIRRQVSLQPGQMNLNLGAGLDARYDELLAATSRASAQVAATAGEASSRLASSVMASQVQVERQLRAEAEVLARNVESSQKAFFESVSSEMADSLAQHHAQFEPRLMPFDEAQEASDETLSEGLATNKAELSQLRTMVSGTRRRICETSREVAQLSDELHATVATVQDLKNEVSKASEDAVQRSTGSRAQSTLDATREARKDLEALRTEIGKRLHDEQSACDAVQEVVDTAHAKIYTELCQRLEEEARMRHSDADLRQMVEEERKQRFLAIDDLRRDLAAGQLSLAELGSNSLRSDMHQELVEATEAMQVVGYEMCEAQAKSRMAVRLETEKATAALAHDMITLKERADAEASTMELMKQEMAHTHSSQQHLAGTVREVLTECDARISVWFNELQQELQNLPSAPSSGPQRMDVDASEQDARFGFGRRHVTFTTATPVADQLRGAFAELGRGFGDLKDAAAMAQKGVQIQSWGAPSPGSPRSSVPALVLPATSGRASSPPHPSGLRQSSPSAACGISSNSAAPSRGRRSSPAGFGVVAGPGVVASPIFSRTGSTGGLSAGVSAAASTGPVLNSHGRRGETPLCAWNGGVQGAPPQTPRDSPAWS